MSRFSTSVDLSQLPAPDAVEELTPDQVREEIIADFLERYPEYSALVESDLVQKFSETVGFREMLLRARVNASVRAVLLALSSGSDLDQVGAFFGVARLENEKDARYKRRIQLAPEAYGSAGAAGAYEFHALTAAPTIRDASAVKVGPGSVLVTVMGGDAVTPSDVELALVSDQLFREDIKPLTDRLRVAGPSIHRTTVRADLVLYAGPDGSVVRKQAEAAVTSFLTKNHFLGSDLARSALFGRLHLEGVHSVDLITPAEDILLNRTQAYEIEAIDVRVIGRGE
jgi:phage-related baseplate assembly protein